MGLNRLEDPELFPQLAQIINAHPGFSNSHAFYLGMLNECEQSRRREMYDALRPHLKFDVWPLEKYISLLKEHASNVESVDHPVVVGKEPVKFAGREFREVRLDEAEGCLLKLTCYKCSKWEEFFGISPVEAVTVARGEGWKRDLALQKEVCPKCSGVEPEKFFFEQGVEGEARLEKARLKRQRKAARFN